SARFVVRVGAIADQAAVIPDCACVDDRVRRLGAERLAGGVAVGPGDRLGPRLPIPEPRVVVLGKHAEDWCAESDGAQRDRSGGGEPGRGLVTGEILVRQMNETTDARI